MQPFDDGPFDKRYADVLAPAIQAAALDPYRIDQDPSVSVPIDSIESGIRNSAVCLADITVDNPNVWFELGFAIASGKEVVLLCARTRTSRFPFDIQHRHVITYDVEAPRDFETLKTSITERLGAAFDKSRRLEAISSAGPVANTDGMTPQEVTALAIVFSDNLDPDRPPSASSIRGDMNRAGFTPVAATVAIRGLMRRGYLSIVNATAGFNRDDYSGYVVTPTGEEWLLQNQDKLALRNAPPRKAIAEDAFDDFPEDIDLLA